MNTLNNSDELGLKEAIKSDILSKKLRAVQKLLPAGFEQQTRLASEGELKRVIAEAAISRVRVANEEATDEDLIALKDQLEALKEDYRNTRSELTAKIKWCVHLLETHG